MLKTLTALLVAGSAFAQTPTVGRILDNQLRSVESEVVSLTEAMPDAKFNFAPTNGEFKGVRTFAQQAKHIAAVNYMLGAAVKREKPGVDTGGENGPDSMKSKAEIVKFLKDSFAYLRAAASSVTAEGFTEMVPSPFGSGQMPNGTPMSIAVSHPFDHYGQMVVYARMNGVIPPASMPRGK